MGARNAAPWLSAAQSIAGSRPALSAMVESRRDMWLSPWNGHTSLGKAGAFPLININAFDAGGQMRQRAALAARMGDRHQIVRE